MKIVLALLISTFAFAYSFNDINATCETTLKRTAYTVCYSKSLRSPLFSAYELDRDKVNVSMPRYTSFLVDPDLQRTERTSATDYNDCGDRGHLSPAEFNDWSDETRKQANYLSNIVPQDPTLNRWGAWREAENIADNTVNYYGKTYEVSGAIFTGDTCNTLNVPSKVYKLIVIDSAKKFVVFLMSNKTILSDDISLTITTPDELNKATGIKFNVPGDYTSLSIQEIEKLR
jgi:DNA/RNA endonuclease G (NUC1)